MTHAPDPGTVSPSSASGADPVGDVYQGVTWDERAQRFGTLGAALDPADRTGRKNRYIDRLHRQALDDVLAREVARRGSPFHRALDFGCGGGRLTGSLLAYADDAYGVDPSAEMLALALELGPVPDDHLRLWRTGLLPFEPGFFDLFISVGVTLTTTVLGRAAEALPPVCSRDALGVFIEQVDASRGLTLDHYVETLTGAGFDVVSAVPIRRSSRSPFRRMATVADWPGWVVGGLVRAEMADIARRPPKAGAPGYADHAIVVRRAS